MNTWAPEIEITIELARRLIEEQFPVLTNCRIKPLGFGWDNTAFLVNDEFVFRFPRRQLGADCMASELLVLPHIAEQLSLPVPKPVYIGQPTEQFPWPFAGYQFLTGETACSKQLTESQRELAAIPLAEFLRSLHSIPMTTVEQFGAPPDRLGRLDPIRRIPRAEQRLQEMKQLGLISNIDPWLKVIAETATSRPAQANALVHGDLYLRHILVNDQCEPCGIIDWGDVHVGDIAIDLSIAHSFLPFSAHAKFRAAYGPIDEQTWMLARFRALQYGTYLAPYAHSIGDANLLREAMWILKNVVESLNGSVAAWLGSAALSRPQDSQTLEIRRLWRFADSGDSQTLEIRRLWRFADSGDSQTLEIRRLWRFADSGDSQTLEIRRLWRFADSGGSKTRPQPPKVQS